MTDRNEEIPSKGTMAAQDEAPCVARETATDAWYASGPARRGGLDTGARGWRWLLSGQANQTPATPGV